MGVVVFRSVFGVAGLNIFSVCVIKEDRYCKIIHCLIQGQVVVQVATVPHRGLIPYLAVVHVQTQT